MSLLDFFRTTRPSSASVAKERLQILVAHEHSQRKTAPSYLPKLQKELLAVISKYVQINPDDMRVNLEQNDHEEILELSISLPDEKQEKPHKKSTPTHRRRG
ncbi:MAG: cell division topological specificity factor MinE [Gammaproteobacteria bacterium]|nr:cell division topological specificity factor MinE [Gammaproteobacteria bacterium]